MEAIFFRLNAISVIGERTILCEWESEKEKKKKSEGTLELQSGKSLKYEEIYATLI